MSVARMEEWGPRCERSHVAAAAAAWAAAAADHAWAKKIEMAAAQLEVDRT